jgi:CheY-like chemotaxis protein
VVLTASSGDAAVRIGAERAVDAAIIDYHIPDWRGDLVLAALVAHQPHLSRRTVFITGDIGDRAREVCEHTGCPLLIKPFDIEELEWHLLRLMQVAEGRPPQGREISGA